MGILDNNQEQEQQQVQSIQPTQQYMQPDYGQYPQMFNPMMQAAQSADVIKYRLESDDLLDNLEHDLKGDAWDNSSKQWIPSYGRWINSEGMSTILSVAARYVNRGSYLGNLKQDQINFKCQCLKKELARLIFKKYKIYDIDPAKRVLLTRKVVDCIHLALSRSEEAFESRELGQSTSTQNIVHEDKTPQNTGIFSMFNRFGKR